MAALTLLDELVLSVNHVFAVKLDALALATLIADANIPESSVAHATATRAGTMLALGEAMAAKQPLPESLICNAEDFVARASQLASTAGSWLGKPPALDRLTEFPTTALAAGTAFWAGSSRVARSRCARI